MTSALLCLALAQWSIGPPMASAGRDAASHSRRWCIDYAARNVSGRPASIPTDDVRVACSARVSNSALPGHGSPRLVGHDAVASVPSLAAVCPSGHPLLGCLEAALVTAVASGDPGAPPGPRVVATGRPGAFLAIPAAGSIRIRLTLTHDHFLAGGAGSLLGVRDVTIAVGSCRRRDLVDLTAESAAPWPVPAMSVPPGRCESREFAAGSLHLAAHAPGESSFRHEEFPVPAGGTVRLRWSYLVAGGTEGVPTCRAVQYSDTPTSWKVLADSEREAPMAVVGRWATRDELVRLEPMATSMTLEFRVPGERGEVWVDHVVVSFPGDDVGP